jgi:hypothetical protein
MTATAPTLDESIEAMKKEIIEDVKSDECLRIAPRFPLFTITWTQTAMVASARMM